MSGGSVADPDVRAWSLLSGLGRVGFGVAMLLTPEPALRALGFDQVGSATITVTRLAGVRDLVLGLVTLAALQDRERLRAATIADAVADTGDALAFSLALGSAERSAGSRGLTAAVPAAIAGAWTAWRLS